MLQSIVNRNESCYYLLMHLYAHLATYLPINQYLTFEKIKPKSFKLKKKKIHFEIVATK